MTLLHKLAAWNEAQELNNHTGWQKDPHFRDVVDSPIYKRPYRWIGAIASHFIPGFKPYKEYDMGVYKPAPINRESIFKAMVKNEQNPSTRALMTPQQQMLKQVHDSSYKLNFGNPYGNWI